MSDELISERRGAVQWVIFNRPQARNALTWHMYDRLVEECEAVNRDRQVRAMVLTGAGGEAFVAGTDISQFRAFTTERDALEYEAQADQDDGHPGVRPGPDHRGHRRPVRRGGRGDCRRR